MRLSRAKTGDARGRPTCESSLLGVPDTKFFCGKPAWKKIRLQHEESNQFRKRRLLWVWAGKAAPSPTTPSCLPIQSGRTRIRVGAVTCTMGTVRTRRGNATELSGEQVCPILCLSRGVQASLCHLLRVLELAC